MPQFVVLLRGVNVGKGNRVPMAEFARMLEELGYQDVQTLRNSGNAVVRSSGRSAAKHARHIADALAATFGVTTPVIVKSSAELAAIVEGDPLGLPTSEHSRYVVAFAPDAAALRSLEPLVALAAAPERLILTSVAAYLHCPEGLLQSKVGKAMLGKAGRLVTTRNWATVLELHARTLA